eukprot:6172635-Pleurochrysis_carterae.AAC.1
MSRSAYDQASEIGYHPSSVPVDGSGGRPAMYNRAAGRLIACCSAKRKHLTMSISYSDDSMNGSSSGTRTSQMCRRLSLASECISTSARTSSTNSRSRYPRRRSSSALCSTAETRLRPAR